MRGLRNSPSLLAVIAGREVHHCKSVTLAAQCFISRGIPFLWWQEFLEASLQGDSRNAINAVILSDDQHVGGSLRPPTQPDSLPN